VAAPALVVGLLLALLILGGSYFNGKEPGCTFAHDFMASHPDARTFESGTDSWGLTCTAIDDGGRVLAVKHYPSRADWLMAGVALVAPLALLAGWRRLRR
jgi:hypothetical protein